MADEEQPVEMFDPEMLAEPECSYAYTSAPDLPCCQSDLLSCCGAVEEEDCLGVEQQPAYVAFEEQDCGGAVEQRICCGAVNQQGCCGMMEQSSSYGVAEGSFSSVSYPSPFEIALQVPCGMPQQGLCQGSPDGPCGVAQFRPCTVTPQSTSGMSQQNTSGRLPQSPCEVPQQSPYQGASRSPFGLAPQSPCGVAPQSPCGVAPQSSCGVTQQSPCGVTQQSPCGVTQQSPCQQSPCGVTQQQSPCQGAPQSPCQGAPQSPCQGAPQSPCQGAPQSPCGVAPQSPCEVTQQSPCGVILQSRCQGAPQSPCEMSSQSPCGVPLQSPCGVAPQSPCGVAPQSPCGVTQQSPCGVTQQSPCQRAPKIPCQRAPQSPSGLSPQNSWGVAEQSSSGMAQNSSCGAEQQSGCAAEQQSCCSSESGDAGCPSDIPEGVLYDPSEGIPSEKLCKGPDGTLYKCLDGALCKGPDGTVYRCTGGILYKLSDGIAKKKNVDGTPFVNGTDSGFGDEDEVRSTSSDTLSDSDDEQELSWSAIPGVVLERIFRSLSCCERLRVSSVCRRWRSILYTPSLWYKIILTVVSRRDGKKAYFLTKCIRFAKYVKICWPAIITRGRSGRPQPTDMYNKETLKALFVAMKECTNLRVLILKLENPCAFSPDFSQPVQHCLQTVMKKNRFLVNVSFGCNATIIPHNVIEIIPDKTRVNELHVARFRPPYSSSNLDVVPVLCANPFTSFAQLHNLKEMTLDWCNVTPGVIQGLSRVSSDCSGLSKLNILVSSHSCSFSSHPSMADWHQFALVHPSVRISLAFVRQLRGICNSLKLIQPSVFMVKVLECSYIDPDEYIKLLLWQQQSLKALVHVGAWDSIELESWAALWPSVVSCPQLQHLAFIGHFILDEILLFVTSHFRLRSFLMTKPHIMTFAEATPYLLPTSASKYNQFRQEISAVLRQAWDATNRVNLHGFYFAEGKDDSTYIIEDTD